MKFTIITPVYNGEKYLAETIESVLSQEGDFEIEYIVRDGESTDGTIGIVKHYEKLLNENLYPIKCKAVSYRWFSEKDRGMYDAINKGFAIASGNVYAYINADDFYMPGAFAMISKTLRKYPEIKWLKGITSHRRENEDAQPIKNGLCQIYNQQWIAKGIYGRNAYFIQQDSVFWKKELWEKSGGLNANFRYAGDYDLWMRFAHFEPLWSLNFPISVFRTRAGQLSENMRQYREEQRAISVEQGFIVAMVKLFFWLRASVPVFAQPLFDAFYPLVFWRRNKYYINIDKKGDPTTRATSKFFISKITC